MASGSLTTGDLAIWERAMQFRDEPSATAARALLKLQFSQGDRQRMRKLAANARAGTLTETEQRKIDTYERLGCVLDILHSKARQVLKRRNA